MANSNIELDVYELELIILALMKLNIDSIKARRFAESCGLTVNGDTTYKSNLLTKKLIKARKK